MERVLAWAMGNNCAEELKADPTLTSEIKIIKMIWEEEKISDH
jgi:hypothetical protein